MPNPNGGDLTEDLLYTWSDGDVYEISQLDTVEGAATGATFDGLGVLNEPHQVLLNKARFLYTRQNTNIANIATLLAFMGEFSGSMQTNGYLKIPFNDIARGAIELVAQWGTYSLAGQSPSSLQNGTWQITWPIAFPNAAMFFVANWQTNSFNNDKGCFAGGMCSVETGVPGKTSGQFFTDWDNSATIFVAGYDGEVGVTGVTWLAVGF